MLCSTAGTSVRDWISWSTHKRSTRVSHEAWISNKRTAVIEAALLFWPINVAVDSGSVSLARADGARAWLALRSMFVRHGGDELYPYELLLVLTTNVLDHWVA